MTEEATAFLESERFLGECEIHGYTIGGRRDLRELWPIAVKEWKRGRHGSVPWAAGMDQRAFTDVLQAAYNDNCGDCYGCLKTERE